ncbi:hypothetical protein GTP46_10320 [Duganella sp. FT135W]|uniref:Uncharacterized protein n=1 Tax=Duganella flavida TaxID=2692175 RepID=A0A6L8K695_9BURK|nr:hypothetical protein [Duganella flavida]
MPTRSTATGISSAITARLGSATLAPSAVNAPLLRAPAAIPFTTRCQTRRRAVSACTTSRAITSPAICRLAPTCVTSRCWSTA